MRVRCALRLPGRPLVWLALALCALSCAYSLYRMENLPTRERAGRLTGIVAEVDAGEARLLVRGAAFSGGAGEERLPGNVLLDVETPYAYPLEAGSRICAEVWLLPLQAPQNPGGWDERTYLFTDGVVYRAEGEILAHEDPAFRNPLARARRPSPRTPPRSCPAMRRRRRSCPRCSSARTTRSRRRRRRPSAAAEPRTCWRSPACTSGS